MRYAFLGCLVVLSLWAAGPLQGQDQPPQVERNTFASAANPKIRVKVEKDFKYVGSVPFAIDDQAQGSRYVFVRATRDRHIRRMFIIQQEGFLASSDEIYRYKITNPVRLGRSDYQHSVIMDDNGARIREEPGKEAELTQRFLAAHGYVLEPELVMSRFARPTDKGRKHEIIFFCYENLSSYGHELKDFPEGSDNPEKQKIKRKVEDNCRNAFLVKD